MNDLPLLAESWTLALRGEGAAVGTVRAYRNALDALATHLGRTDYTDATKDDMRRWIVAMRLTYAQNTIRQRVKITKAFYRWLIAEGEMTGPGPAETLRAPNEVIPDVQVLTDVEMRALLATCDGNSFRDRRDQAMLHVLADGGLRREECAGLLIEDINLKVGTIHVRGKGSRMRGERHRVVSVGARTCRAIDRYLRARAREIGSGDTDRLWISNRHHGPMTSAGVRSVVEKRGREAGVSLHAHMLRHGWASGSRKAGLSEGDLMVLGGWSDRRQLDRYGRACAAERARDAYRQMSVTDRLGARG